MGISICTLTTSRAARPSQVTNNKTWDVRWPSSDNEDRIVYELNGELQVLERRDERSTPISINVPDEGLRGGRAVCRRAI